MSPAELLVCPLLKPAEHVAEVEAGGLLTLRVVPERLQEFPDIGLRRHQQIDVVDQPIVIGVRRDVGALKGVRPKIENLWHAQVVNGSAQIRIVPGARCSSKTIFQLS